jgi:PAS domain S-box-containing protein
MKANTHTSFHSRTRGSSKRDDSVPDKIDPRQVALDQDILANAEEVARMGSWKWDLHSKKLTWSDGMFRLFGMDRENFDGDAKHVITSRIHPDDVAAVNEANRQVLENGNADPVSYRIVLPEGIERTVWAQGKLLYDEGGQPRFLTGYVQDITERVRAENRILQLQRMYATLSQVNQVIVRVKEQGELFQRICDVAVAFGGFDLAWVGLLDDVSGEIQPVASHGWDIHNWPFPHINIHQEEYRSTLTATAIRTASVVTSENIHTDERLQKFRCHMTSHKYFASAIVPLRCRGRIIGILSLGSSEKGVFQDQAEVCLLEEMSVDISFALDTIENEKERRQAEKALQESENRYRDLVETSNDAIFINCQGRISFINRRGLEMFGASSYDQVIGRSPDDFFHPDFHALGRERIRQVLLELGPIPSVEQKIISLDGRIMTVEVTTTRVIINEVPSVQVILRDITERKQAEEKLRLSEEKFRTVLEHTPDIIFTVDEELRIQFINRTLPALSIKQVLGSLCLEYAHPEHRGLLKEKIQQAFQTGGPDSFEVQGQGAKDTTSWYSIRLAPIKTEQATNQVLLITTDITERKQVEEKLRQSEEKFRAVFENSPDIILTVDREMRIQLINRVPAGLSIEQVHLSNCLDYVLPEHRKLVEAKIHQVFLTGQPISYETQAQGAHGAIAWYSTRLARIQVGDTTEQVLLITSDITESKQAGEKLRQSEENFSKAFRSSPAALMITRLSDGQYMELNDAYCAIVGYHRAELIGHRTTDFDIYINKGDRKPIVEKLLASGSVRDHESSIRHRSGEIRNVITAQELITFDGEACILTHLLDITERKQAEEKLRQSELRYRLISENTADVIWVLDPATGRMKYVSPSVEKLIGLTPAEVMERPLSEILTPKSQQAANGLIAKNLPAFITAGAGSRSFIQEVDHPRRDGSILHTEVTATLVFNQAGEVEIIGVSRDITERKRAEQTLRENEERLRLSLQAASQGLYDLNVQTGDTVVNREYAEMLGYEYESFVETNAYWIERLHPDDREITAKAYADYVSGLRPDYRVEFRQRTNDGGWKWILSLGRVIEYDEEGRPLRMLGTHTDITERKQAEETLRESEARFSKIFQASPMGILIFRLADGRAVNVNQAALVTMGYSRQEILGHNPQELNIFLEGDQVFNDIIKILSLGESIRNQDTKIRRKSGEIRDVLGSLELIELNGEKMVMVITSDITERKRTEEELRASEERYRNLIENMNDIVMEVDSTGNYCYLSPNYSSISEYPLEEELGESALKHIHPDDLPMVLQKLEQALTMERQSATYRVLKKNGQWRWLETVGKPFQASDGSVHLITVARDITERKQAEDALKRNEHVLRLFVEHSPASIAMFDRDMRYIVASRRYITDYRLPDQDLTGRSHYEVFPEIPEHWKEIHRRCLAGTVEKMEEDPFPREDGTLDWVRWEIRPWYEETGRIGGIILFSEVITERKQIQDDLRLLNMSLEQRVTERTMELSYANRAKDEFLANMSHELRTPLNAILGLSESLLEQRRGPLNERQIQSIELVASSGKHLLSLINDILEVSKIQAGKLQLHTDTVSIKELCQSSLNFIKELALKKLIRVEFTCDESISTIQADPQRVKQVLINLLTNAVKFTPERGRVGLDVSTNAGRNRILFAVTDSGIGIAAEDLKKLFTPFTQLDSSLARQYAGTGLGLSLVQKLTEAHGGSVRVESEVGKGSRFTVVLPFTSGPEAKAADDGSTQSIEADQASVVTAGAIGKNLVVLLAEDNQVNSEMVSIYLQSCGYTVLVAQNGAEVLQKVEETIPDIILMDIQMPRMDGLETTQRLREDARFMATPIIALTALVMPGDRERCLKAGANEYLSKPVSLKTLVSTIEKLTEPKI